jgi:hypothetical protein
VRLQDVYWSEEGRTSFDAVICTCAFAGLVVIGTRPFGLDEPSSVLGTAAVVGGILALAIACFAKGRVLLGVVGIFIPVVAAAGALRLAKPTSLWAKWRYDPSKLDKARHRFALTRSGARARRRLADFIAGAPSRPDPAPRDESTVP